MRAYLGLAMMTVCVAALGGGFPAPAHPDDLDAARLLSDSKRLLQEQQEIERKLANSQARTEELRLERERMSREAERINNERQTTRDTCGTPAYYYTHRAECEQGSSQLSTRRAEVDEQQRAIGRRFEATTSEIESLKVAGATQTAERDAGFDVEAAGVLRRDAGMRGPAALKRPAG